MDKNARLYYQSAQALRLPVAALEYIYGFEIKLGKRRYFFRGGETPFNCGSSLGVASNKYCMNKMLAASGFPVPEGNAFNRYEFKDTNLDSLIKDLNFPLVVKPMSGTATGTDVICNITTTEQLRACMKERYKRYEYLSVEAFHSGLNSYRVLVFYNRVIGVVQRFSARVVGDNRHTIRELVAIENIKRKVLEETVSLGPIKLDEEVDIRLNELGMTLETIPKAEETVILCYTCNSTRGGTMHSLGKKICIENAKLLCNAARALDLNIVGFDVACEDILTPIESSRGVIIEANHNPDITIHENPMTGVRTRVSKVILRQLIMRHPVAYLSGLFRASNKNGFYFKSVLILSGYLVWKSVV